MGSMISNFSFEKNLESVERGGTVQGTPLIMNGEEGGGTALPFPLIPVPVSHSAPAGGEGGGSFMAPIIADVTALQFMYSLLSDPWLRHFVIRRCYSHCANLHYHGPLEIKGAVSRDGI
jgi:hypothetical protein